MRLVSSRCRTMRVRPVVHTVGLDADRAITDAARWGRCSTRPAARAAARSTPSSSGSGPTRPRLCLVQIATAERLAVIDPVEGAPLDPVAELMADPAVEKVMHAPSGDLAAFVLHHDVRPRRRLRHAARRGVRRATAARSRWSGCSSSRSASGCATTRASPTGRGGRSRRCRSSTPPTTSATCWRPPRRCATRLADAGPARRGSTRRWQQRYGDERDARAGPRARHGAGSAGAARLRGEQVGRAPGRWRRGASARPAGATCRRRG